MSVLDYTKCPADQRVGFFIGPSGGPTVGVTDVYGPLIVELNNTGGTSLMVNAAPSVSWNDWSFGTQASDTQNEPSLADAATYQTFGKSNYGGDVSFYIPAAWDDNSNTHSLVYDLTDAPGELADIAVRIDGDISATSAAVDGQFVSVYRVAAEAMKTPFTPGESKRRTVSFINKGAFAHWIPLGTQTLTTIPATTASLSITTAKVGRFRAAVQGRDVTNMVTWKTSNAAVIDVSQYGGYYKTLGTAAQNATITATHPNGSTTATIAVTLAA